VYAADMEVATEAAQWHGAIPVYKDPAKKREAEGKANMFRKFYWDGLKLLSDAK